MALAVRSPRDPFRALVRQLDGDFDGIVRRAFGTHAGSFVPAAEIRRDGADVLVSLDVPGVDVANDVSVEVSEGRLVITGERASASTESQEGDAKVLVRETVAGKFRREFTLPDHVSPDDVAADYDRGVLRVRVRNVTKPTVEPRKIEVRRAGDLESGKN
ncbi:HSP20 family protein [Tamaricihabitans halophyticus]|uniref:HSP20 family protein n=1 Tax=Tamaricihabitans halophyticus TaxID=1262583 RepID=A0A4R2RBN5_9PSEU|nr:Hsp20/alpha crystallin family protein [Tamaricihabitans halophyticus]TCP57131.1 HSP20 family protein [Tamaricihabitans halophyticus]